MLFRKKEIFNVGDIWQDGMGVSFSDTNNYMSSVMGLFRGMSDAYKGIFNNYEKVMLKYQKMRLDNFNLRVLHCYARKELSAHCEVLAECGCTDEDMCDDHRVMVNEKIREVAKYGPGKYTINPWQVIIDDVNVNNDSARRLKIGLTTASKGVIGNSIQAQENVRLYTLRRGLKKFWKILPKCKKATAGYKTIGDMEPCESYKSLMVYAQPEQYIMGPQKSDKNEAILYHLTYNLTLYNTFILSSLKPEAYA